MSDLNAWGDPHACVEYADAASAFPGGRWNVFGLQRTGHPGISTAVGVGGATEAEALIAALEAAPEGT